MSDSLLVLHEDLHLLAVSKPPGLLTQAGAIPSEPTLEALVRRHLRPDDPSSVYLGTVHRLDRPVSGVIVWAKTPKAARRLAEQFAGREPRKEYWAVVSGRPDPDEGVWDDWLCLDDTGLGAVQVCRPGTPRARRAVTRYRREDRDRIPVGRSWLRLWPETGRTHQLRVQASSRGLPILGDRLYGSTEPFPEPCIALHARSLTIRHPVLEHPLCIEAPVPEGWDS